MSDQQSLEPPRHKPAGKVLKHAHHGRLRRVVGLVLLVGLLAVALAYRRATDPQRVRAAAVRYLAAMTGGRVAIERARFSMFGGIELSGVQVAEPGASSANAGPEPILTCADIRLRHSPLAALTGRLVVEEVVAVRPTLSIYRDVQTGHYNVGKLLRSGSGSTAGELPTVRLREARVRFGRRDGDSFRLVEELTLNVVARPQADGHSYEVAWTGGGTRESRGRTRVDLRAGAVTDLEGGLPWLTVEGAFLAAEARFPGVHDWPNLLGLDGRVQVREFVVSAEDVAGESARAVMELSDATVSLPLDEQERLAPVDERFLRFTEVNGQLEVTSTQARARFSGLLQGSTCRLDVVFTRLPQGGLTLADIGFTGRVRVEGLRLPAKDDPSRPAEARFVARWRKLRHLYRDYDPHGVVNLDIAVTKPAGHDAPVTVEHVRVESVDTDASYRRLPYRLAGLTGTAEFRPEGVRLINLTGRHDGGTVTVNGTLREPKWYTGGELRISGQDISIDRALHDALGERYRNIWDRFELGGRADLEVSMERAQGTPEHVERWRSVVDARFTDLNASFHGFPYLVEHITGKVRIDSEAFTITDLAGECGTGRVVFNGRAATTPDGSNELDLHIEGTGLAFDQRLYEALPAEARRTIKGFDPQGWFDLTGRLTADPDGGGLVHDVRLTVRGASFTYVDLPIPVTDLHGELSLTPGRVAVDHLEGRWHDTRITVSGLHDETGESPLTNLRVSCQDLQLTDELHKLLPESLRRILGKVQIDGPLDSVTEFVQTGSGVERHVEQTTRVTLRDATLIYEPFPLPLTGVGGTVTIGQNRVEFDGLTGRCGDGSVSINGQLVRSEQVLSGGLRVTARGMRFDEALRSALPWRLRRTWNNVHPTGGFDLEVSRLEFRPPADEGPPWWDFEARLTLASAGVDFGVKLANATGTVTLTGTTTGEGSSLAGRLELDSAEVNGYRLTGLTGLVARSAGGQTLTVEELKGRLYGGSFAGSVEVDQSRSPARYSCSVVLTDVSLGGLIQRDRPPDSPPVEVSGRCNARLFVRGQVGDPRSSEGGGRVDIQEARLFKLPLLLRILNVLGLVVPVSSAAQTASASFHIMGGLVELRDIVLRDPTVAMVGSGRLRRDPYELDLRLIAASPHRWFKVPVLTELLEGAARELVELEVRGPLSAPQVQSKPLRGVSGALETLLGKAVSEPPAPKTQKIGSSGNSGVE